jgi:hypothetical protein
MTRAFAMSMIQPRSGHHDLLLLPGSVCCKVTKAVALGDLSKQIELDAHDERLENTVNGMVVRYCNDSFVKFCAADFLFLRVQIKGASS